MRVDNKTILAIQEFDDVISVGYDCYRMKREIKLRVELLEKDRMFGRLYHPDKAKAAQASPAPAGACKSCSSFLQGKSETKQSWQK